MPSYSRAELLNPPPSPYFGFAVISARAYHHNKLCLINEPNDVCDSQIRLRSQTQILRAHLNQDPTLQPLDALQNLLKSLRAPEWVLEYPNGDLGHKFGLPDMPLPRTEHFRRRYDPVVETAYKESDETWQAEWSVKGAVRLIDVPTMSLTRPIPPSPFRRHFIRCRMDQTRPLTRTGHTCSLR
jgi:hypothetical protein